LQPAKKGRRAAAGAAQPASKESNKDLSLIKDEADETIDLFESRHYAAAAAVCEMTIFCVNGLFYSLKLYIS